MSTKTLLWELDFTQPNQQELPASMWSPQNGDGTDFGIPGWGNQELQFYVADEAIKFTENGLEFHATKEATPHRDCYYGKALWTSARVATKDQRHIQYGWFEVTMQVPTGKGTWPAFWLLGHDIDDVPWPHCGEIDIMEARGIAPNELIGTVHGPSYFGDNGAGKSLFLDAPLAQDFHTFAIDWKPDQIDWYLDGEKYHSVSAADLPAGEWVFNKEYYILMNLAIGGGFAGQVDPDLTHAQATITSIRHFAVDGVGSFTDY